MVRGLAMERIALQRIRTVVLKEIAVGLILGFVYGLLVGAVAQAGYGIWQLGLLVAMALLLTMTISSLIGALLPMTFARCRIDPAVATGPFVTTAIDIFSISFYFGLATLLFGL